MSKPTDDGGFIPLVPMPEHLEPENTSRSLFAAVKAYYYPLYNAADKVFQRYLASLGNKDSVTKNRNFDRCKASEMIKEAAKKSGDTLVANADEGIIWKHVVKLMKKHGLNPKLRKEEYRRLTRQDTVPAE